MEKLGELVGSQLSELLTKLSLDNVSAIANASDEELLQIPGIGPATLEKLRAWVPDEPTVKKGKAKECVSLRYLVLAEGVNIAPGDVIPPEFADEQVAKGKARWR